MNKLQIMTVCNMKPSAFHRNLLPPFQGGVKKDAVGSSNTLANLSYQNIRRNNQNSLLMS
jgi:hypothetical protein